MTLRLALRLVRGGGVAGFVRLCLVIFGIALGVTAGTLVAVMPGVLGGHSRGIEQGFANEISIKAFEAWQMISHATGCLVVSLLCNRIGRRLVENLGTT